MTCIINPSSTLWLELPGRRSTPVADSGVLTFGISESTAYSLGEDQSQHTISFAGLPLTRAETDWQFPSTRLKALALLVV